MRLEKNGSAIASIADWERLAPPKAKGHWVKGRSALELARAWCEKGVVAMPAAIYELLESRSETIGLEIDVVIPENRIVFDSRGGEPRNADLAFLGRRADTMVAVTIEAKTDESFGATVAQAMAAALERLVQNPRSQGVNRICDLARALVAVRRDGQPSLGGLRYQLLTALAGTVAYALEMKASVAVMLIHEFVTPLTTDEKRAKNQEDYVKFLHRLSGECPTTSDIHKLLGPFSIPALPLFERSVPLLVGKATSDCRLIAT